MTFRCGRFEFALERPLIMGIVNVTPDSFSDGGRFLDPARAIEQGLRLREEGADLLDLGGESTRPGAEPVSAQAEIDRVLPVLQGLAGCGAAISIDTMKPEVMRAALAAGADMINDVKALEAPGALAAVAAGGCGVCLMHMQGEPRTMQTEPVYGDVAAEVGAYLKARFQAAMQAGIAPERIVVDPGFGFGKTLEHNLALFRQLAGFGVIAPVLAGVSRKSMLGRLTRRPVEARQAASVAAALLAVQRGAAIVRVHDVAATADAIQVWQALK